MLEALQTIGALDVETIVPGHGEPCTKAYLKVQQQIVEDTLGIVEDWVKLGLSEEEALGEIAAVRAIDPYPPGQRFLRSPEELNIINIRNLYRRVVERTSAERAVSPQSAERIGEIAGR